MIFETKRRVISRALRLGLAAGVLTLTSCSTVESRVSEQRMRELFEAMDLVLCTLPEVGEYKELVGGGRVPASKCQRRAPVKE